MIQLSTLLSLFLAGLGSALTIAGSISALNIRRTRLPTNRGSSRNETGPAVEGPIEYPEGTGADDTLHGKIISRSGVGAIFSDNDNAKSTVGPTAPSRQASDLRRFSTPMLSAMIGIAVLSLYGVAVWQYPLHESMQSWVRANFGAAAYLLNYDALLVVSVIVALQIFSSQFRARSRKRSGPDRRSPIK